MKFSEAMAALEQGKKVRVERWKKDQWISLKNGYGACWPITPVDVTEEWELYEEPVKLLTFAEVINGLKIGKKFKRKEWSCFVQLTEIDSAIKSNGDHLSVWDFEANDWIEVP